MSRKILFLVAFAGIVSRASDSALDRKTLRGIPAVNVVVDAVDPQVEREGVTRESLRARVEEELRGAGIVVDKSRMEFVGVRLTAAHGGRGPFAVAVALGLYQPVVLSRDPKMRTATQTWEVETVILADSKVLHRACEESVEDLARQFAEAYLEANPGGK